jgi:hypothetical protein
MAEKFAVALDFSISLEGFFHLVSLEGFSTMAKAAVYAEELVGQGYDEEALILLAELQGNKVWMYEDGKWQLL